MPESLFSSRAQACIWMSAGLLSYKLCDRGFDCEHCPLDAALRGEPDSIAWSSGVSELRGRPITFPEGLLYSRSHTWVRSDREETPEEVFFGLDAFAAALIGRARAIDYEQPGSRLSEGDSACRVDVHLGVLSLESPFIGEILDANLNLKGDPERVIEDPYETGWILKFRTDDSQWASRFLSPDKALSATRSDLQCFRHRVARYLLDEAGTVGPTLEDGGQALTDLRQILGAERYLSILRELIY